MDPYQVLGVSPQASDDEIKKAYREQARKYHPDNYHENPLADLASEKMKAINEAYDSILRMRENKGSGSTWGQSTGGSYGNSSYGGTSSAYAHIRNMIAQGNLAGAQQALNAATNKNAEWHFLMGSLSYRKGMLDQARQYIQKAVSMEPHNREYQTALYQLSTGGFAYRGGGGSSQNVSSCDCCDCCTALMCLNCCCGGCS